MKPQLIEKEWINLEKFPTTDVLPDEAGRTDRLMRLRKALALGNLEKQKVRLVFDTCEGRRAVDTTIWALCDYDVLLKGGTVLPIRAIREVEC